MKKILVMVALFATTVSAVEILNEFYVMERVIPFIEKGEIYELNGLKIKATKVDSKILKVLATTDDPFYFFDSNKQKTMARIGDYLVSPLTLSEIYSVDVNDFLNTYIQD